MKKKIINLNLLLVLVLISISTVLKGQVTVGLLVDPQEGAALEILTKDDSFSSSYPDIESLENSTKGVLFPKVRLDAYNSLTPLYENPSVEQRYRATGMTVYNVNPSATNLEAGLYVWDSEKWVGLSKISSANIGKAIVEASCDNMRVYGSYDLDETISNQNVYVEVDVNVKRIGNYSYYASCNGVMFSAIGTFTELGATTVELRVVAGNITSNTAGNKDLIVVLNSVDTEDGSKICTGKTIPFVKTGAGNVIKILNIGGTNDNTGLTSSGDNYAKNVYYEVGKWLSGSASVGNLIVPHSASYYANNASVIVVDMKKKYLSDAALRAELETASIVWMGAYQNFPYAHIIKEWHDKGNGVVIATADIDAQAAVCNALGYHLIEGSNVDATSINMTSPTLDGVFTGDVPFVLYNGMDFKDDGANGGLFTTYPASAVGFMASEKNPTRYMGLADPSNRAFIFADKYGDHTTKTADYWTNFAKVLVDIFAWSMANSNAY